MSYIVFDVGGTNLRLAFSPDGKTLSDIISNPTPTQPAAAVEMMAQFAQNHTSDHNIQAIAGGIPGPMDKEKTMILNAPNLPEWKNFPLKTKIADALSAPTILENDATLAGVGEAVFGAGQGKKIVAYITVSTGLGGTRIVDGQIDPSSLGFEPGHHIIHEDGLVCSCGTRGHLEAYASGAGLKKQFGKAAHEISDPAIWRQVAHELAMGLNNIICFWSPDIIVLGGSLMKSLSIDDVSAELTNLKPVFPTLPPITKAKLGDESGLYGALAHLRSACRSS